MLRRTLGLTALGVAAVAAVGVSTAPASAASSAAALRTAHRQLSFAPVHIGSPMSGGRHALVARGFNEDGGN